MPPKPKKASTTTVSKTPLPGVTKPAKSAVKQAAAAKAAAKKAAIVAATTVAMPTGQSLSAIQDKTARSRHLRASNTRRGKKLAGKVEAWDRKALDALKGVSATTQIPDRKDLRLTGTEADPGKLIKPHLDTAYKGLQNKTLTAHIAGAPAYICKLAEDAAAANKIDYVFYAVDQQTGRSEIAVGRIEGKHKGRGKGSLPKMLGDAKKGDHAGHGTPEGGVHDPDLVNQLPNIVPQDGTANVSHKKVFENQVIAYADSHQADQVHTIHERFYAGDSKRPLAETHYFVVNGVVSASMTLENP